MDNEIQIILNRNIVGDLTRFLGKRQCLNATNMYMNYIFHFVQTSGLLTTAIAQSYGWSNLIWVGIGLNSLATLLHIYEHNNNKLLDHMMQNIKKIKNGTYIDESSLIDEDDSRPLLKTIHPSVQTTIPPADTHLEFGMPHSDV